MDTTTTWSLIHRQRARLADTLDELTPSQWAQPALCAGWTVQITAGHVVVGAEQTPGRFVRRLAANGFRFNRTMDRDARQVGAAPREEIVERLRATTTTTNHPPAAVVTMLGEVVVHAEDIRQPLGLVPELDAAAVTACLDLFAGANFPVGAKPRIAGLRLIASDADWVHGAGPEVVGPSRALLLAMTGRSAGLDDLGGAGLPTLRQRTPAAT
jgi:uncharacterized protein (TIGR03083 family)